MRAAAIILASLAAGGALCAAAQAQPEALQVLAAQYRADIPHPESDALWASMSSGAIDPVLHPERIFARPALGGNIHVYLRNASRSPVEVEDVLLGGISLKQAIAYSDQRKFKRHVYAASIYFSDLPEEQRDQLVALGEPIWWRVEPARAEPEDAVEVTVRLRRDLPAQGARLTLKLKPGGTQEVNVPGADVRDRITDIAFSEDLSTVWLFVRSAAAGRSPSRILMDGTDVTAACRIARDPALDLTPVVFRPPQPLEKTKLYSFQAIFSDGAVAAAARRAFPQDMRYGTWGSRPGAEGQLEVGRQFVREMAALNMNLHMVSIGSAAVQDYFKSPEGQQALKDLDIRRVVEEPGKQGSATPHAYYLADEPDTGDYRVQGVPPGKQIGCLAQGLVQRAQELRLREPATPSMLNLNLTFTPQNWYIYGQVPDIFCADPYYQPRLRQAYEDGPGRYPLYAKAGFVYAETHICKLASEPRPLHIILYANSYDGVDGSFRGPTPAEKRIELYYALAAGAKGFSYWWFLPGKPARGLAAEDPATQALRREVGLMGAEIRTLGPLITRSAPLNLSVQHAPRIWVRALACGDDSILLVVVNDDYINDRTGTVIRPVQDARLSLRLPDWLDEASVFEVNHLGTADVAARLEGRTLHVEPGTVEVTRAIIITRDAGLRQKLQTDYERSFAANVRALLAW
ncbi:MAG: hypothetical protein ACUVSM_01525 [Armatimonadota bacterium]|jgi:hypothetical protein